MSFKIYLTGSVTLELDGRVAVEERQFRGKQGRLVFAYLVCQRARAVSREELVDLLWPDGPAASWEIALSAVLSRIRHLISHDPLQDSGASLSRGSSQYQLRLPLDIWVDIEVGAGAIERAEIALKADDRQSVLGPATAAAAIARRPFLSGLSGRWVESQRDRLRRQLLRSLNVLSKTWLIEEQYVLAIEMATEAITIDPHRDASYQLLMNAHAAAGNRSEALKVYHKLREYLSSDLGTEPSPDTQDIYLRLLG
ncbi:MAG: hypothetical protein IIC83_03480 [Chloroflexi bacterium]|nr:hypothetical protein [Chloroflexota bacterium]